MRNDLLTRHYRLLRLKETVRKRKIKLTDEQIQALEHFDPEYRKRHIQANATGNLSPWTTSSEYAFFVFDAPTGCEEGMASVGIGGPVDANANGGAAQIEWPDAIRTGG